MTVSLLLAATLWALPDQTSPDPVAVVLDVSAAATLARGQDAPRPLRRIDLLREGDRIRIPEGGRATLVVLDDGHQEVLVPGADVVVKAKGCQPPWAVVRQEVRLHALNLEKLRELSKPARSGRAGMSNLRSEDGKPIPYPRVTPLDAATVLSDRPNFSWPPVEKARSYQVKLITAGGQDLWTETAAQPSLPYPADRPSLEPLKKYHWQVTATVGGNPAVVSEFSFLAATRETRTSIATLPPRTTTTSAADLLLAALIYEGHYLFDDALTCFEALAKRVPEDGRIQQSLVDCYERAGRTDEAKTARAEAEKRGVNFSRD